MLGKKEREERREGVMKGRRRKERGREGEKEKERKRDLILVPNFRLFYKSNKSNKKFVFHLSIAILSQIYSELKQIYHIILAQSRNIDLGL